MPVMTGTALNNLSYEDLVRWVNLSSGNPNYLDNYIAEAAKYGVDEMSAVEDMAATYMNFYKDGNGAYTITSFSSDAQISSINPIDSNVGTIARGNVQTPLNRAKDAITNKLKFSTTPASGSFAQNAKYFLGSVGQAVGAASVGITLGKTIDGALYNANPNFWDNMGLSSLNPETWNSITNGDDSWQAGLFNLIFGLDPDTGNSQLYMNQNALAYMAMALAQNGFFNTGASFEPKYTQLETQQVITSDDIITGTVYELCALAGFILIDWTSYYPKKYMNFPAVLCRFNNEYVVVFNRNGGSVINGDSWTITNVADYDRRGTVTPNILSGRYGDNFNARTTEYPATTSGDTWIKYVATTESTSSGVVLANVILPTEGIGTQEDATLPDTTNWDTIPNTLSSLQNQYPDMFQNPLVWDNYQPDGTNPQQVYIPVASPNSTTGTNTHPTSSNSTQVNPQVNPATSTQALIDFLTNVITQPNPQTNPQTQEETDTQPKIPPQNPVDTGTGETPAPLAPIGSASALWSVYHPTQAQVNSFGAWLWGSPFLTNIGKLFQNPIEGVISLHKVFVTPVDSGTGTIVVGTLDSGVSSATVNQQYIEVDCGSVTLNEDFGNVFDYDPYTKIALYLPFVGIVPLNVSDVMRSTINVKYGVDIFTGACIAMVGVSRDGNDATLYQYSGNCAVHYPLSNVQQSQLLSGLITVAAGIGAIVATGGAAAPAAATGIASGAMSALHTNIGRSGGFSANAGAMGIKTPYLIIERPQTKVAKTFPELAGYPTNYSCKLNECSGHVVVKHVHIEGINATDSELDKINNLLMSGVIV